MRYLRAIHGVILACSISLISPASAQDASPPIPLEDHDRAVECLTLAIAYESGFEPIEGQRAVAEVVMNRVRAPGFPKSVCNVVFAGSTRRTGCQFTFTCDGSLARRLPERVMLTARTIAEDALNGRLTPEVPGATHYHADYVNPYWAPSLIRVTKIGAHIFYRSSDGAVPGAIAAGGEGEVGGMAPSDTLGEGKARKRPEAFAPWGLPIPKSAAGGQ